MEQTVTFNPELDEVEEVLDFVARGYGYSSAVHALDIKPKRAKRPEPVVGTSLHIQTYVSDDEIAPWTEKLAVRLCRDVTIRVQKAIALSAVSGFVPYGHMCDFLGVDDLQGVFSSLGAAVNRLPGLKSPHNRPIRRYRRNYDMEEPMQRLFRNALIVCGQETLLVNAEQFLEAVGV
jgi:hypothetical protein